MAEKISKPQTKGELLSQVESSFSRLFQYVEVMDEDSLDESLKIGDWTIKDNLAHIAAWEDAMIRYHFQGEPFDQVAGIESAQYWVTSDDEINEHFYQRYRDWSGERLLSFARQTHEDLLEILEALPEKKLFVPPAIFAGEAHLQIPLIDFIAENTYEHYEEHFATIQEIVERNSQPKE
jgi:hypothetical protein